MLFKQLCGALRSIKRALNWWWYFYPLQFWNLWQHFTLCIFFLISTRFWYDFFFLNIWIVSVLEHCTFHFFIESSYSIKLIATWKLNIHRIGLSFHRLEEIEGIWRMELVNWILNIRKIIKENELKNRTINVQEKKIKNTFENNKHSLHSVPIM